jgi:2-dehydro-3-deoxyphosphogluconate aldolase/(4S)-4-hydroxy-2-oxoglutarate aldolase
MNIRDIVGLSPVIPVLTIGDVAHAVPLARALIAGGLRLLEVSLRSTAALGSVEAIRKAVPEAIVGCGALTRPADFAVAGRAGAQFGSSPGLTPELAAAARGARFPLLPGVMTPTEVIAARHAGFDVLRFFPAQQAGGIETMRGWATDYPDVLFCPMGGVTGANARDYLALANVVCVAGPWIAPGELILKGDWLRIEALAKEAAGLKQS